MNSSKLITRIDSYPLDVESPLILKLKSGHFFDIAQHVKP